MAVTLAFDLRGGLSATDDVTASDAVATALAVPEAYPTTGVAAQISCSAEQRAAAATLDRLAAVPAGSTHQLWVRDGSRPNPAGLFVPGPNGRVQVLLDARVVPGVTIGVTIEPIGGSLAPTGEVLFTATV